MNYRLNNNPDTGVKAPAQRPLKTDHRLSVLLLFGMFIIGAHFGGLISPEKHTLSENGDTNIMWLAGTDIPDGLYSISSHFFSPEEDNGQSVYTSLGLRHPSGAYDGDTIFSTNQNQQNITGRWLESGSLPIAIPPPANVYPFFFEPLPINEADSELLTTIPGIGVQLAAKIITLRQKKNHFSSPDELLEVSGISHTKLEKIIGYLAFN